MGEARCAKVGQAELWEELGNSVTLVGKAAAAGHRRRMVRVKLGDALARVRRPSVVRRTP